MKILFVQVVMVLVNLCGSDSLANQNQVSIREIGSYRFIESNGIPNHQPGRFPNAYNPNAISEQTHQFRVPINPVKSGKVTDLKMHPFGVAVNGVTFDPGANEFWGDSREWQYEPLSGVINLGLDHHHAHVQPTGAYHYHGMPLGLLNKLGFNKNKHSPLIGYAADGFPIYANYGYFSGKRIKKLKSSYRIKKGYRPSGPGGKYDGGFVQDYEYISGLGDLDQCNGRVAKTPDYPGGIYYYVLSESFPVIPRCFKGAPDVSFFRKKQRPRHRRPPHHRKHPGAPHPLHRKGPPPGY